MTNMEIELKLRVDPLHLARFRNSSAFADSQSRAATQNLESVYYDTEDFALRQRGITLRVRKKGKSYVQTLKVANEHAGGVFSRGEWECPVSSALPDLGAFNDPEAARFLGVVDADTLKPVFASHIKRSVRLLNGADGHPADTVIEVAVDQGELRAIDGTIMPIAEVELELKSGTPQALFDLALKLTEVAPVRVETRTKAERGYALVAGEAQSAVKAQKLELKQEHTAEQALASIMRNCLSHAVLNEAAALKGEDPEGIHQMRVALRRLRSALNLFRELMPADQYEFLAGEVKWLAGELGNARNLDVFLEELLAPVEEALGSDKPTEALHRAAVASRTRAYEQAQAAILSTRYTVLLLRLGGWLESRSWRQQPLSEEAARLFAPVTELADGLLAKRHRKARKLGKRFAELAPAERHQLRIALKKLRYAAEFFRSLYGEKEVAQYLKRMSALQDDLGHLNDVATAETLMDKLAGEQAESQDAGLWRIGGGMVIGWHARGLNQLEPRLVRDWEKFAKASPFWSKPSDR